MARIKPGTWVIIVVALAAVWIIRRQMQAATAQANGTTGPALTAIEQQWANAVCNVNGGVDQTGKTAGGTLIVYCKNGKTFTATVRQ